MYNKPAGCAKLQALALDIDALRQVEPNMRVVVLTHFLKSFDKIVTTFSGKGYKVLTCSASVSATTRHSHITQFQSPVTPGSRPFIFVATMQVGNVGITLTSASRVYLFEPCLDPQMEVQAAGRIHRLGQTRPVMVKKFLYRDSVEEQIHELHEKVKNGSIRIVDGVFPEEALKILSKSDRTL